MNAEYTEVGGIRLLDGEEVCLALDGRYGLLHGAPPQDDFAVVTNQRLICFARKDGKRRRVLLPIGGVESVEVTDLAKNIRPLVSGGLMLLAAVGVSWAAAVVGWSGVLPWIIAAALAALGALTASSYFVSEDSPSITFRTRTTEVSLALRSEGALRDAYRLANGPFLAQAGQTSTAEQGRAGKDEAAAVADSEGDAPVEPPSEGASPVEEPPPVVSASVEDEGSAASDEEPPTGDASPEEEAPPVVDEEQAAPEEEPPSQQVREVTLRQIAVRLGRHPVTISRWAKANPRLVARYPERRGQSMILDLDAVIAHARTVGRRGPRRRTASSDGSTPEEAASE